jgi:microcompartment protein CcmL/EutN
MTTQTDPAIRSAVDAALSAAATENERVVAHRVVRHGADHLKRSLPERILAADTEVCRLLANANEAKEAGQTKRAERLYAAAQKALDKYNVLTGKA